jgi:glutathione S-transferase
MYAITAIVLTFKMAAISIAQGRGRLRTQTFTNPEDVSAFGGKLEPQEAAPVARAAKAWRNDLENIPIFLILAWIYVAAALSLAAFEIYCVIFMIARIIHTITYLSAVQPWRTISYTAGALAMLALVIHLLIKVVFV